MIKCKICSKEFENYKSLGGHSQIHQRNEYLCSKCGISFPSKHGKTLHEKVCGIDKSSKINTVCQRCNNPFSYILAFPKAYKRKYCNNCKHAVAGEASKGSKRHYLITKWPQFLICEVCLHPFFSKNNQRFCPTCKPGETHKHMVESGRKAGKKSAQVQRTMRRSKSEKYLAELCEKKLNWKILINDSSYFDGWDFDIVIPEPKLVIAWDGPTHHRNIYGNLKQTQSRDRLKRNLVLKLGWKIITISDYEGYFKEEDINQIFTEIEKAIPSILVSETPHEYIWKLLYNRKTKKSEIQRIDSLNG